jgi:hypothetical protein
MNLNRIKKLSLTLLFVASFFASKAQNDSSDKQAVQMLKEFYTAYNTVCSTTKGRVQNRKLDSLQRKYCTKAAQKELKDFSTGEAADHDPLINDEYTDVAHLKTLKIVKDLSKTNAYIVSYVDHTLSGAYKPIDKTVVIHVTVEKENGVFKIADTTGDAVSLR